jgi:ankyrin repeat protein
MTYFSMAILMYLVFQNGADVNMVNANGDTALHKAAFTSRLVCAFHLVEKYM